MRLKTLTDDIPSINLTPMLDVVFNLMIFFMVATQFADMERQMDLNVPSVSDAGPLTPAPKKQVINVTASGSCTLNGREYDLAGLTAELANVKRQYPDLGVLVRGDGQCKFENVARVLAACSKARIAETSIAVRLDTKTSTR